MLRHLIVQDDELDATAVPQTKDLSTYVPASGSEPTLRTMLFCLNNVGTATAEIRRSTTTAGRGAKKLLPGDYKEYEVYWPLKINDHLIDAPLGADILISVYKGLLL